MENRYDSIEYGFEDNVRDTDSDVKVTQKDGFITSQHYIPENDGISTEKTAEKKIRKEKKEKNKNLQKETVIICQLVLCIILAIAAYVIKSLGGEIYETVKEAYYDHLNNSLVIDFNKDSNDQAVKDLTNDIITEKNSSII